MEKNSDVEARLAELRPDPEWKPDPARAMTRFEARRAGRRRLTWAAAVAMTASVFVIAFPEVTQRVLTPCVNACQVFFLRSAGVSRVSAADKVLTEGQPAPDFKLKDSKGAEVRLSTYKGKVVLLDFWATWCGGCKVEIPWFIEFESQYKSRGLTVIGVSMDDDGWKLVKPFIEAKKMNYPVVIGDEDLAQRYGGVDSLPETLLIGRDGKVAAIHVGLTDKAIFEKKILELLGK